MGKRYSLANAFITVILIIVIVQSWIVLSQNRSILKHLETIASGRLKVDFEARKIYDEKGNEIRLRRTKEDAEPDVPEIGQFVDANELMRKAKEFEFEIGKVGGSITYAVTAGPKTFNLILNREASTSDLLRYAYDPLVRENYITGEWDGVIAEKWELSEDGLECLVYIRKDVQFFDGHTLTANDVVFTYNDLLDNKDIDVGGKGALIFRRWNDEEKRLEEGRMDVEIVDDHTVRFTFPWREYSAINRLDQMVYPEHVLKKYVENGTFNTTWDVSTDPKEIIGSGPWRPWEFRPGERFVLVRNPNYWLKDAAGRNLPYIERINFSIIEDRNTSMLRFEAGDIDFLTLSGDEVPLLIPKQKEKDFTVFGTGPTTTIYYLAFNMNHGKDPRTGEHYVAPHKLKWFKNLKFRKAMAHCIDKKVWINDFMNGFGVPLWSPLSPASTEFYNPHVVKYEFDLDKAAALLDEIGYIDRNNDGVREDPDGNPIKFIILTGARDARSLRPITMFISDLSRIGIEAQYVSQEYNTWLNKLWTNYEFDATFIGEMAGYEVGSVEGLFTTWSDYRFYKPNYKSTGTEIIENINNREDWEIHLDKLFSDYKRELNREKRKRIGFEIQEIISENLPVIFTVVPERIYAIRNKFRNVNPTVRFYPIIWPMMEYTFVEE